VTRRDLLLQSFFASGAVLTGNLFELSARKINIGACDWSLGADSNPAAFDIAKQIGLPGILVNLGNRNNDFCMRKKGMQQSMLQASAKTGVKISSLAIGVLNDIPFKKDPLAEELVWDSIDVAKALGVTVILVAFFNKGDLRNDEAGIKETIQRFKKVAPKAEKAGIYLGIESYLDANQHKKIIEAVGSPNLKVYYDFRNTADAGYDTIAEFRKLGPALVCELHMKENSALLGKGTLDWNGIARAIKDTGYYGDGWMQIEGAMPEHGNVVDCYKQNLSFLKNLFE